MCLTVLSTPISEGIYYDVHLGCARRPGKPLLYLLFLSFLFTKFLRSLLIVFQHSVHVLENSDTATTVPTKAGLEQVL